MAKLRSVAIQRIRFKAKSPGQKIGVLAIFDCRIVGHVDRLGDSSGNEWLGRCHHADVAFGREIAFTDSAARIGTVEDRQVFVFQIGRALKRHGAAAIIIGVFNIGSRKAQMRQQIESQIVELAICEPQSFFAEILTEGPFVKGELDIEAVG